MLSSFSTGILSHRTIYLLVSNGACAYLYLYLIYQYVLNLHLSSNFSNTLPPFPVLKSFYQLFNHTGRPTSLIIDFGAQATRIIPVVDGFTLNKSIVSTARGGNWIDLEVRKDINESGKSIFNVLLLFLLYFSLFYFTLLYFTHDLFYILLCLVIVIRNKTYLPAF